MKRITAMLLLFFILFLSGCESVRGLGRDIQNAGRWMEQTAEKSR